LVYALGGVLFAVPFDIGSLEKRGGPVPIVEGVARGGTGVANFSFSETGSLVFVPGPASAGTTAGNLVLALVDRQGNVQPLKAPPATYGFPRVSRDGKRVAYGTDDGKEANIWVYDLSEVNAPKKLTFGGANRFPVWSADGERVAFQSDREGDLGIWWVRADGNGTPERLTKPEKGSGHIPDAFSPDGQTLLHTASSAGSVVAWAFSLRDKKATPIAEVPGGSAGRSVFSSDGRWIAFQAGSAVVTSVFVQPFPPTGAKYQVPQDGNNHHPVWSVDGQLFYVPGNGRLASVSVTTRTSLAFGPPVQAPKGSQFMTREPFAVRSYDLLPDGKHFIGTIPAGQAQTSSGGSPPHIQVVLNWFEDLKQRVPVP